MVACLTQPDIMRYSGVIKKYGQQNGYGFVTPDETLGVEDLFFARKSLPLEFHTWFNFQLSGKHCTFQLVQVDGNLQAHDIQIQVGSDGQFLGTVKSYNPVKGFGFIQSSFFPDQDVFFSKSDLPPYLQDLPRDLQGKRVRCIYSEKQGKPQAKSLSFEGTDIAPGGSERLPMERRKEERDQLSVDASGTKPFVPRYHGRVKSLSASFGFIQCDETYGYWERDVFLHSSQIPPDVEVGTTVTFEVQCRNGQPQARNVRHEYHGQVKSYGKEKGFGFIVCEDTHKYFGRDVYVSEEEFKRSACAVLDEVLFQVSFNKKGEPQAHNIEVLRRGPLAQTHIEECAYSEASTVDSTHTSHMSSPIPPFNSSGMIADMSSPSASVESSARSPAYLAFVVSPPPVFVMWAQGPTH